MVDSIYVLDANVFIEAKRHYYPFDLVPFLHRFWEILVRHALDGRVLSIDRVKKELLEEKDELSEWAKKDFSHAFASTNEKIVLEAYAEVIGWVQAHPRYYGYVKAKYAAADEPDAWLIAYAKAKAHCVVVTHEVLAPYAKKEVKIPDVCQGLNVPCVNTFQMLRALGVRLA